MLWSLGVNATPLVRVLSLIEEVVVRRFTEEERVEVWDRWQAGDGYRLICRDLGLSAA